MHKSEITIVALVALLSVAGLVMVSGPQSTGAAICPIGQEVRIDYVSEFQAYWTCQPRLNDVKINPQQSNVVIDHPHGVAFENPLMKKQRREQTLVQARYRPW